MTRLTNPLPLFLDADGSLLDAGFIFVGVANADPQSQPVAVYFDEALTIRAAQPLRTLGGSIVNGATPSQVFVDANDYSMRVLNADQRLIRYDPASFTAAGDFQPLDSDLTAIAALTTTTLGRSLLAVVDQQALRDAAGIAPYLPLTGGAVSGNITRKDAGGVLYAASNTYPNVRVFGPENATDPTSQIGDIWFKRRG